MLELVIAWTCVGVFIATALLTLLAVAGVIQLADKRYTDRLFKVLIVEIVGICIGAFTGSIELPSTVEERCVSVGREQAIEKLEPELERVIERAKEQGRLLERQARGETLSPTDLGKLRHTLEIDARVLDGLRRPRGQ
jgi:hypothetical protein